MEEELRDVDYTGYADYLRSGHWLTTRQRIMEKAGRRCPCGALATDVHHLTYARLGRERNDDLVAVCRDCHGRIHDAVGTGMSLREASHYVLNAPRLDEMPLETVSKRAKRRERKKLRERAARR